MQPSAPIDQDALIARLKAKETDAFKHLYEIYSGAIYGMIDRIVPDEEVAAEVLQDAFLKFWDKIEQYDPEKGRLFTWMANISRNLAIDKMRSSEMKRMEKTNPLDHYVSNAAMHPKGHTQIDTIGLKESLKHLREEEQLILELVYFKGYTQSEIVKEYDIPLGTVKTRLRMALQNLRGALKVT